MTEAQRLEKWMEARGFSVGELAEATGDSYSTVYMMLSGKRPVGDAYKWRFAVHFGWREAEIAFGLALPQLA